MKRINGTLLGFGLLACSMFVAPQAAHAADPALKDHMASMAMMPKTADEHLTMSDSYNQKASGYRQDAEMHRSMLADYKKGAVGGQKGSENPWVKTMRLHCETYIKDAEKLATDADKFTEFHAMRAKEMQGK